MNRDGARAHAILIDGLALAAVRQRGFRRQAEIHRSDEKLDQLLTGKLQRGLLRGIDLAQLPQQRVRPQFGKFGVDALGHVGVRSA